MCFFMSFYLESCIWSDMVLQLTRQRTENVHQILCKSLITDDESWIYSYDPET
jgi:hypothetical protein